MQYGKFWLEHERLEPKGPAEVYQLHVYRRIRDAEIAAENIAASHCWKWLNGLKKRDFPVSEWRRELEDKLMLEY